MDIELIKSDYIKLKKEIFRYYNDLAHESSKKELSSEEKFKIYRQLKQYNKDLESILYKVYLYVRRNHFTSEDYQKRFVEFDLEKDFLSSLNDNIEKKNRVLQELKIDEKTMRFRINFLEASSGEKITDANFSSVFHYFYTMLHEQLILEKPIYIFYGYYDATWDDFRDLDIENGNPIYGFYIDGLDSNAFRKEIPFHKIEEFEKNNTILYAKEYVADTDVFAILKQELENQQNKTFEECITNTRKKVEQLNIIQSPAYKEQEFLRRLQVQPIREEIRNGSFEKKSVLLIPITPNKEYVISLTGTFPFGNIKEDDILKEASQELIDKTGYYSNHLFLLDYIFDNNSIIYIVVANNCVERDSHFTDYGLFSEEELGYLINHNIMRGTIDRLAYYSLCCNTQDDHAQINNIEIYKFLKEKTNPFEKKSNSKIKLKLS